MTNQRRDFIKATGLTAVAAMVGVPSIAMSKKRTPEKKHLFNLGLASYSLRKFETEEALTMSKKVGLNYVCLKSMHLPLDSNQDEINRVNHLIKDRGMTLSGGGVIYMKDEASVDEAFEYAKKAGMKMIVGVPEHELLKYVEKKVKKYDIILAIHNHGPGDEKYPSPESVYEKIKKLDKRMGLCHDIGHTKRIKLDPVVETEKYLDRTYDFHIKDVNKADADGQNIEIGRGVIDIPAFLRLLVAKKYSGLVSFEYEKDADDPLAGLAESVGYVNGVLASI
ncbi:MAG: sugar phosphate isomerase/epimerase [Cyclobacteriaceae bacterium]|nr:sugar phosphate isomerase/epimerase [Cyclobacteriaceae bacterium]